MNMVIPDEGKEKILDEIFRLTSTRESFKLDLFVSNTTVVDASTATDFTLATFTGYAQLAIARGDFGAATIAFGQGIITKTVAPSWTCTGGSTQTAYGWILRGATSGIIYAGQNFDAPRSMPPGTTETLDPFEIKDDTL